MEFIQNVEIRTVSKNPVFSLGSPLGSAYLRNLDISPGKIMYVNGEKAKLILMKHLWENLVTICIILLHILQMCTKDINLLFTLNPWNIDNQAALESSVTYHMDHENISNVSLMNETNITKKRVLRVTE